MTPEARKRLKLSVLGLALLLFAAVVLAFVVIVPRLGRVREGSGPVCAANFKGIGNAFALYSAQFNGQLPVTSVPFTGSWMCDQPIIAADQLLGAMAPASYASSTLKTWFYCPSNHNQDAELLWNFAPFRITGYVFTNDRSASPGNSMPSLDGLRKTPPLTYHQKFVDTPNPHDAELAADWIISPTPAGTTWTGITSKGRPGTYDTSHMKTLKEPAGANILHFDGSVRWRPFDPAKATAIPQGGGPKAPVFWIPNP
jgi:prepilin-type processing-associated H-X9-DG protein